jgi:hypothetical protein
MVIRFHRAGIGYTSCQSIANQSWTKMGIFDAVHTCRQFL